MTRISGGASGPRRKPCEPCLGFASPGNACSAAQAARCASPSHGGARSTCPHPGRGYLAPRTWPRGEGPCKGQYSQGHSHVCAAVSLSPRTRMRARARARSRVSASSPVPGGPSHMNRPSLGPLHGALACRPPGAGRRLPEKTPLPCSFAQNSSRSAPPRRRRARQFNPPFTPGKQLPRTRDALMRRGHAAVACAMQPDSGPADRR